MLSHIDFCNDVITGLPVYMFASLQCMAYTAAWFLASLLVCAHVTDTIQSLHLMPVAYRTCYKLCLVMYAEYKTNPSYVADTTTRISSPPGCGWQRSANSTCSIFLVLELNSERVAFSLAGLREWNALLAMIRNTSEVSALRMLSK